MLEIDYVSFSNAPAMIVRGRYDISSITVFEDSFKELLERAGTAVGVNLKDLTYIDSSGIGSLIRCFNLARKRGITCYFYDINSDIMTVFQLSRLDSYLKVVTNEEFELRFSDSSI
ncbi:MAG: STAS domain-containing protein [Spirochaetes bacterium]|nr:STAS domain-containing protein [Spirochaetota bacterium]MBN2771547.1 STAS domain-containing protein [Spirochaetota bacterium]HRX17317.1 STAS domain-containing protein [Spirochaetota bacterium]